MVALMNTELISTHRQVLLGRSLFCFFFQALPQKRKKAHLETLLDHGNEALQHELFLEAFQPAAAGVLAQHQHLN